MEYNVLGDRKTEYYKLLFKMWEIHVLESDGPWETFERFFIFTLARITAEMESITCIDQVGED